MALLLSSAPPDEPGTGQRWILIALAAGVPVALIWLATAIFQAARTLREDCAQIYAEIHALRTSQVAEANRRHSAMDTNATYRLEQLAERLEALAGKTAPLAPETPADLIAGGPPAPAPIPRTAPESTAPAGPALNAVAEDEQGMLDISSPDEARIQPPHTNEFIRALNFPLTAHDTEGFAVLRRAMQDHQTGLLIQAAEDVLTLFSQDGIYMDDLTPDRAKPDLWRSFADGARGREVAGIGAIHDPDLLAHTIERLREDPIFRDAAHHFLRRFDTHLSRFVETASDEDIVALGDTRTARAFMVLGRATGIFG